MSKRHRDAILIQEGAVNPSGIALALVDACREVREEGGSVREDPACFLITHQLASLYGIELLDGTTMKRWDEAMKACKAIEQHDPVG